MERRARDDGVSARSSFVSQSIEHLRGPPRRFPCQGGVQRGLRTRAEDGPAAIDTCQRIDSPGL